MVAENQGFAEEEVYEEGMEDQLGEDPLKEEFEYQIKQAPIWLISITFHALLLFILSCIIFAMPEKKRADIVVSTDITTEEEEPFDPKKERKLFKDKTDVVVDSDIDAPPVIVDEDVPVDDHFETDNNMDMNSALGDEDAISDIPLSGKGIVGTIGVGGGGGGTFGNRMGGGRRRCVMQGGGSRGSESAVNAALRWLARHQEQSGQWDCQKYGGSQKPAQGDPAVTGMALLAFLGAGHTEYVGKFRDTVRRSVQWLVKNQKPNGQWGERNYEHGICLMAMAEAVGMGGSSAAKESALKGIDFCLSQQNPSGCWNYLRSSSRDDMSVTGWNIMGLKSSLVAGLQKARIKDAFRKCGTFFDNQKNTTGDNESDSKGLAWYTPKSKRGGNGQKGDACVAIGMLCRQFMGWRRSEPWLQAASDNQIAKIPNWGNRNVYRIYYACLTLFQMGGKWFQAWNKPVRDMIINNQRKGDPSIDGSWDYDSKWCKHGGRVMSTALLCLSLEVYYRYESVYSH